jgi:hypothetical protein
LSEHLRKELQYNTSRVPGYCNPAIVSKTNTLRHETHGTTDMLSQLSPSYIFTYLPISCTIDWAQTPCSDAVASHVRRWTGSRSTRIPANVCEITPWQEFEQDRIICTRIEHQLLIGVKQYRRYLDSFTHCRHPDHQRGTGHPFEVRGDSHKSAYVQYPPLP